MTLPSVETAAKCKFVTQAIGQIVLESECVVLCLTPYGRLGDPRVSYPCRWPKCVGPIELVAVEGIVTSRKKRLLFDVLDNVFEPADEFDKPKKSKERPTKKKKSKGVKKVPAKRVSRPKSRNRNALPEMEPSEFKVSFEKAGAVALVVILLIAVSYWLGVSQGEGGILGEDPTKLSRETNSSNTVFDRSGNHYAVKAATLSYNEFTIKAAKAKAGEFISLLWNEGYGDAIHSYNVDPTDPTQGQIIIWVGRSDTRKQLARQAKSIRSMQSVHGTPFKRAYITLFSAPKKED